MRWAISAGQHNLTSANSDAGKNQGFDFGISLKALNLHRGECENSPLYFFLECKQMKYENATIEELLKALDEKVSELEDMKVLFVTMRRRKDTPEIVLAPRFLFLETAVDFIQENVNLILLQLR